MVLSFTRSVDQFRSTIFDKFVIPAADLVMNIRVTKSGVHNKNLLCQLTASSINYHGCKAIISSLSANLGIYRLLLTLPENVP
eukprot:1649362-Prymnesium_polylepis.1